MADEYLDELCDKWQKAMEAQGHLPIMNHDHLDFFAADMQGFHNGPKCAACGWDCCWHCSGVETIPQCTGG
jgi:hypothetical protein